MARPWPIMCANCAFSAPTPCSPAITPVRSKLAASPMIAAASAPYSSRYCSANASASPRAICGPAVLPRIPRRVRRWTMGALWAGEPTLDERVTDKFGAGIQAELCHCTGFVGLDRLYADSQPRGHLLVGIPGGCKLQDFCLAGTEFR